MYGEIYQGYEGEVNPERRQESANDDNGSSAPLAGVLRPAEIDVETCRASCCIADLAAARRSQSGKQDYPGPVENAIDLSDTG